MRGMFVILLIVIQLPLFAQKKIISGKVVNETDNEPLSGVSVILKSSQSGVITNNDGNFKIEANPNDVLLVSIVGFSSQSIPVKGRTEINISLKSEAGSLSDVVLVGSRGLGRAKTETAVPVDVIKMSDISLSTAKMDVTSILLQY